MAHENHSLNYELPHELQFNKYAQQILENSKQHIINVAAADTSTPTISNLDATTVNSDFLQKLSVSFLNSLSSGGKSPPPTSFSTINPAAAASIASSMDFTADHITVMDGSSTQLALDELQKQLDYDKFMNEIWIGVVMTLILISMVFCICSCFLYHQFRTWKRNYRSNMNSSQALDIEGLKHASDFEDPVPEYTLVSGLPSYEAALELLHKTPKSCLIVYPSVFSVFNKNEKSTTESGSSLSAAQQQQQHQVMEITNTTPLLSTSPQPTSTATYKVLIHACIPSYEEAIGAVNEIKKSNISEENHNTTITIEKSEH